MSESGFSAGMVGLQAEGIGTVIAQWYERIEGVVRRIDDLTPALEAMTLHFQAHLAEVFASQGGDTRAGAWKALSEPYATRKAAKFPGEGILEASGALRIAMTGQSAGEIKRISGQELEVGGSRNVRGNSGTYELGVIHQLGEGQVPPRPIIDVPDHLQSEFIHDLADYIRMEK